jgi:alkanesulfonate monooxygenase SsuD/methylene tetrahydromethanopterin reductase-like flavin-dependent oxidoreductase (luciferase family)
MQLTSHRVPYVCVINRVKTENREHPVTWISAETDTSTISLTNRFQAATLYEAQQKSRRAMASRHPDDPVLLDIEVVVADTAANARRQLSEIEPSPRSTGRRAHTTEPHGLRYVGTIGGLRSLIMDIWAIGIADGVVLTPLSTPRSERLIVEELPELIAQHDRQCISDFQTNR